MSGMSKLGAWHRYWQRDLEDISNSKPEDALIMSEKLPPDASGSGKKTGVVGGELVAEVAKAIHAEAKAWRLQTDGNGRYRAIKDGYSRELMGGPTREEAEAAFEALVDEQCARAAIAALQASGLPRSSDY